MLKTIFQQTINFLFPPFCHLCNHKLERGSRYCCKACWTELQLLDTTNRCQHCFSEVESEACTRVCTACKKRVVITQGVSVLHGICFEDLHAPRKLVYAAKMGCDLAQHAVLQFMIVQLINLRWPIPHVLVPLFSKQASLREKKSLKLILKGIQQAFAKEKQNSVIQMEPTYVVDDKYVLFVTFEAEKAVTDCTLCKLLSQRYPKRVFLLQLL